MKGEIKMNYYSIYREIANMHIPSLDELIETLEEKCALVEELKQQNYKLQEKIEKVNELNKKYLELLESKTSDEMVSYMKELERSLSASKKEADSLWHQANPEMR